MVIEEAIRYIDRLHDMLDSRLRQSHTESSPHHCQGTSVCLSVCLSVSSFIARWHRTQSTCRPPVFCYAEIFVALLLSWEYWTDA